MAMGYGLQNLLTSPMAGDQQQQFPDPTTIVDQLVNLFGQHLEKESKAGRLKTAGGIGTQQPVGISPRERAGRMRTATGEGAATYLQQAGETAAEPWKPKGLDIGLIAAAVALPIIAALQPEGRGRRGQRKQQRMSELFKTLGSFAGQGLQARMGSFETGKEATYEAAEKRAEMSVEEAQARHEREIGGIEAAESKRRWEKGIGLAERGMAVKERPKPEKGLSPSFLNTLNRQAAADARRQQTEDQKNILVQANKITRQFYGTEFVINSVQDLDEAIYDLENIKGEDSLLTKYPGSQKQIILQQLRNLRDQYYGGTTPMLPMGGGEPTDSDFEARRLLEQLRQEQGPLDSLIRR